MHGSCAVCSPCCLCLVICGAEFGVVGGVHVIGCGARCQVPGVRVLVLLAVADVGWAGAGSAAEAAVDVTVACCYCQQEGHCH